MRREIHELSVSADVWYSSVLTSATTALPESVDYARRLLEPIAGEVWMGRLSLHAGSSVPGTGVSSRPVSDRTRAEVFLRDGFVCSYCGGRTIPRCILVAISDVFPDELPYHPHYRRGTVHPVYWALAPEADHVVAHSSGGSSEAGNLTTLHAMCNTRKSSLAADSLPVITRRPHDVKWDGLLSRYADIVAAGETVGRRHSAPDYHRAWLRRFGRLVDTARIV